MLLDMHQALRCHAKSKRSGLQCQAPAVRGHKVCRCTAPEAGLPGAQERPEAWRLYH
jgi:hypothetical protein